MSKSTLLMGIDTGGTYTDAVIISPEKGEVVRKAKALTTPGDFSIGVNKALDNLGGFDSKTIKLVSISTTLATNAIVEGRGGRVGLLLIGYDHQYLKETGFEIKLPVVGIHYISGGHDVKGEQVAPLDRESSLKAINDFKDRVDALAISSYFSVMNPEHEIEVRGQVLELTSLPVVCGYELTQSLNANKRALTTVINARLISVIHALLDSIKAVLVERGIDAPLMVVKGDGSIMSENAARIKPVDTILSGPAASAVGAQFLAGIDNAIVVDMGGTTTDIAILEDGLPWVNPEGAIVGGWQTCVKAANLRTKGLGGDSHIWIDHEGKMQVGPQRVIPLCRLGEIKPDIVGELEAKFYSSPEENFIHPSDYILVVKKIENITLNGAEEKFFAALETGPLSIVDIEKITSRRINTFERFEILGLVQRAGLTPTDLLWSKSMGIGGSGRAAWAGAMVVARQLGITVEELTQQTINYVANAIAKEIFDKLIWDQTKHKLLPPSIGWGIVLEQALDHHIGKGFDIDITALKPIVAIGAPVMHFVPLVAEKLHTKCIIPKHAEVGNAVGAIMACISESIEILVQPVVHGAGTISYVIHSPVGKEEEISYLKATIRAKDIAIMLARKAAYKAGAKNIKVKIEQQSITLGALSEVTIRARASGQPRTGSIKKDIIKNKSTK